MWQDMEEWWEERRKLRGWGKKRGKTWHSEGKNEKHIEQRLNGSSEVVRLFCIGDTVEQREIEWKQ